MNSLFWSRVHGGATHFPIAFILGAGFSAVTGFVSAEYPPAALAGAAMTFFGFMHGERIGIGESPAVAMTYLAVAAIFAACAHFVTVAVAQPREVLTEPHGEELAV